jgi:hypothetical protein
MILRATKTLRPSSSYELDLPQNFCEQVDGRVSSFWLQGSKLLFQLSSYIRVEGEQVLASDRLRERIAMHNEQWTVWKTKIHPDPNVDQATAEFIDHHGFVWIHSYLVWPHLAVYSTISGPKKLVREPDNWAFQSLRSVRLNRQ